MKSRERVLAALEHRQPDRPPRDLGSTTATGIHPAAYQALKRHLGLEPSWRYQSSRAQLAWVQDPIIERFQLDFLHSNVNASPYRTALDRVHEVVLAHGVERDSFEVPLVLPLHGVTLLVLRPAERAPADVAIAGLAVQVSGIDRDGEGADLHRAQTQLHFAESRPDTDGCARGVGSHQPS